MRIVHTLPAPPEDRDGKSLESLRLLAEEGLAKKYQATVPDAAQAQLEWELQVVTASGHSNQYLMLRDILRQAGVTNIHVSPGYGRLGNSVLAYALGLCEPDPCAYGLVMAKSTYIFTGAFGINVSADRAHELIEYVKAAYRGVDDGCSTIDLVELPALDYMQGIVERAGVVNDPGGWSAVPLDDPATYCLLGNGDTDGVYQLGTDEAKAHLRAWRPSCFTDLLVLTTVNRYGTEDLIPRITARAHGKESTPATDPLFAAVTEASYGFLVWQEQFMRLLMELAGFDGNTADHVRRILCKKHAALVAEAEQRFVAACASRNSLPAKRAQAVWRELESYAVFAMSKAHIVAHGLLTYRMAYLKAHWRAAFDETLTVRATRSGA